MARKQRRAHGIPACRQVLRQIAQRLRSVAESVKQQYTNLSAVRVESQCVRARHYAVVTDG
jgi:hypothetical protein